MRFEFTECKGVLRLDGHEQALSCLVVVENDGEILVDCDDVDLVRDTQWLFGLLGANRPVRYCDIELRDARENMLTSEDAYVAGHRTHHEGGGPVQLKLNLSARRLVFVPADPLTESGQPAGKRVEFFTVGQMGAHSVHVGTSLGELTCNGPMQLEDFSEVAGLVALESEACPGEEWFESAEDLVERVLEAVSFGQGRRTMWSVRRRFQEGHLLETLFRGPQSTTPPRFPPQHFLHMQPIVATAVENYTSEVRARSSLGEALDWYLMHPPYADAQFIAYLLTLEQLSSALRLKDADSTFVEKRHFTGVVVPAVEAAVDEATESLPEDVREDARRVFKNKLRSWNDRGLEAKIQSMLVHYGVPLGDLEMEIPRLVRIRNMILHSGSIQPEVYGRPFGEYLRILREIATRTILTILGFTGQYSSYLSGSESWVSFPPDVPEEQQSMAPQ